MKTIGLASQTMFAELVQQSMDADFDAQTGPYNRPGTFVTKTVKDRKYWYFQEQIDKKTKQTYVGPTDDEEVDKRVKQAKHIKDDVSQRRSMVRALIAAGLRGPDPTTGAVIEALWKAGFFRLRGVLIGTVAFQTYSGVLGVRLAGASSMTQDLDAAQFYDVSHLVDDTMPPILEVLRSVDDSFEALPDVSSKSKHARFKAKSGYIVEFLTPNRGSDDHMGKLSDMPALGGASAIPLRYLDFLIREPLRSVSLYKSGIPVTVPTPARYAIHKLIISGQRKDATKRSKDILQASEIIEAMLPLSSHDLAEVAYEAWNNGDAWRENMRRGYAMLSDDLYQRFVGRMVDLDPRFGDPRKR